MLFDTISIHLALRLTEILYLPVGDGGHLGFYVLPRALMPVKFVSSHFLIVLYVLYNYPKWLAGGQN